MGTVIAAVVAVAGVLLICLVVATAVSRSGDASPRRRDVRRLRANYVSAQDALNQVTDATTRYRDQLDVVGDALVAEITDIVRSHDRRILENNK